MMYVISHSRDLNTLSCEVGDKTIIVLIQDGVYHFHDMRTKYTHVYAVEADAYARGIEIDSENLISYAQWVELTDNHYPWILIK